MTKKQTDEIRKPAEIANETIDTTYTPEIGGFPGEERGRFYRLIKKQVTLRLDADLLDWFRSLVGKYQTRINASLREYTETRGKAGGSLR